MATKTAHPSAKRRTSTPKKAVAPTKASRRQASNRTSALKKAVALDKPTQQQAGLAIADPPERRRPVERALIAAERAVQRNSLQVQVPILGEVQLPPTQDVAFIGGVAALAIVGMLEWPVAVLLGVGHGLATVRHNKLLRAFGERFSRRCGWWGHRTRNGPHRWAVARTLHCGCIKSHIKTRRDDNASTPKARLGAG